MGKWSRLMGLIVCSLVMMTYLTGCETREQTSALIGGAVGAGAGQLIGGDTTSTVIGGAIGAGAGYGYERWIRDDNGNGENGDYDADDRYDAPDYDEDYGINGENTVVVDVTNSDGTTTPVRLAQQGDEWVGPRGERYETFPTEEQLRQRYGY